MNIEGSSAIAPGAASGLGTVGREPTSDLDHLVAGEHARLVEAIVANSRRKRRDHPAGLVPAPR